MTVPLTINSQRASDALAGIQQEQRIVEMENEIFLYDPEAAPLTLFSSMVSKKAVGNPEFKALEDELIPGVDILDGAIADGVTTDLVVTNIEWWQVNTLWRNQQTGEVFYVTAVTPGTSTVGVTRGVGGTAAAAMSDLDTLYSLGPAAAEGALSEASRTTKKVVQTNFTQIYRWPFQLTGTLMESDLYGGDDLNFQQKKAGIEQATRMERSALFGEKAEDVAGNEPLRFSGGIDEFITTNDFDLGATFSMDTFYALAAKAYRHGRKTKMFFASRGIVSSISADGQTHLELMPKDQTLGMDITVLQTPHGQTKIKSHDLLEGAIYGGYAFLIDLDNVGLRHMKNRDNKLHLNIQQNDADSRKDEFRAEIGLLRVLERSHARFTNGVNAGL